MKALRIPFVVPTKTADPFCRPSEPAFVSVNGSRHKRVSRAPSLLFDMELEESQHVKRDPAEEAEIEGIVQDLKRQLYPDDKVGYQLALTVRLARESAFHKGETLDVHQLAERLQRVGYAVKVRTALGGGWGGECLRNLRHTFLTCSLFTHSAMEFKQYIIDPKFREQFEIAQPTKRYARIMEAVPEDFVGTEEQVEAVVGLLCAEIATAFKQQGASLPPWRQAAAMLSKWRPRKSTDRDVGASVIELDVTANRAPIAPPAPPLAAAQPVGAPQRSPSADSDSFHLGFDDGLYA